MVSICDIKMKIKSGLLLIWGRKGLFLFIGYCLLWREFMVGIEVGVMKENYL